MKKPSTFKGIWIPRFILEIPELTLRQSVILSDIFNLCKSGGQFFKSNNTIARECRVSPATIKRDIGILEDLGFIKRAHSGHVRFIKLTGKLKQSDTPDQAAFDEGQIPSQFSSNQPTSSTVSNTVISTFDRAHIDGSRFNEFHDSIDLQNAMRSWVNHLNELGKNLSRSAQDQTWFELFKMSDGNSIDAGRTIAHAIANNWKSLHKMPPRALSNGRFQLDLEQASEWASR